MSNRRLLQIELPSGGVQYITQIVGNNEDLRFSIYPTNALNESHYRAASQAIEALKAKTGKQCFLHLKTI